MADEAQKPNQPVNPTPQSPVPPANQTPEKLGSFVERFRSYESDMARLKGVPLAPATPEKEVKLVPTPPPPENPLGIAGKPEPYVEAQGNTVEAVIANNTIVSDVKKEDPQVAVEALHKEAPVQTFRTIQTDVAQVVKEQPKATVVEDIIAAEQKRNPTKAIVIEDPKRSFFVLMLSGILIGGGLLALGGFYVIKNRPKAAPAIVVDKKGVITTDKTLDINVNDGDNSLIPYIVNAKKSASANKNTITRLNVHLGSTTETVPASVAVSLLSPTIPSWLARSFDSSAYLFGMYSGVNGLQPIFVFKVDSYENAYSGMLKWEETMGTEFKDFYSQKTTKATTTASTTPAATTAPVAAGFVDATIKNKDVRVYQDTTGRRLLYYSFPDQNTIVITTDQPALEEVFARLITSKFVR